MGCNENEINITHWPQDTTLSENAIQLKLHNDGLHAYGWGNGPGDVYSAHEHSYNKVIYVVRGEITFGLPDLRRRLTLTAGDRLFLPRGTRHNAEVGSEGVYCLEAHC